VLALGACRGKIGGSTPAGASDAAPSTDLVEEAPAPETDLVEEAPTPDDASGDAAVTQVGDPCLNRAGIDVRTFVCTGGLACDSTTMLCEPANVGPLGKACVSNDECASNHCADVCCRVACSNVVQGGCGSTGACTPDGLGCVFPPAGTSCDVDGGAICFDPSTSLLVAGAACDGTGACMPHGHSVFCGAGPTCDPKTGACVAADGGVD